MKLRLLSYNFHRGLTIRNRPFSLEVFKNALLKNHLDLIFLQEIGQSIDAPSITTEPTRQLDQIAEGKWPYVAYGKNATYSSGEHGNAIISRFPIIESTNVDISIPGRESRGLLSSLLSLPDKRTLQVYTTHLDYRQPGRYQQLVRLSNELKKHAPDSSSSFPFILAGDFNDWNRKICDIFKAELNAHDASLSTNHRLLRTFPSICPLLPLDRIYLRGLSAQVARVLAGAPWSALSDHLPVFVEAFLD